MINAYRVLLTRARQRIAIVFFIFLLCPIQTFCIFAEVLLKLFEDTIQARTFINQELICA